jgi:hypothetical protein
MAITATIAVSPSTVPAGVSSPVNVQLTVSNSGADDVNVTAITPTVAPNGATPSSVPVSIGAPALSAGQNRIVPAGSSLVIPWSVSVHAPQADGSVIYDVGAVVTTSDGSTTVPTVANLTATEPTH